MQNILAIWQREMKSYFASPIAYAVLIIFLLILGLVFSYGITRGVQESMQARGTQSIDVPGMIAQMLFNFTYVLLLFLIPMLTMGLFSEEKRRGTMELLLTTPVGNFSAMIGKYLASLTFLVILFAASGITMSALFFYGKPDWKPILAGYLGLFLYSAALIALGLFISTLTESQIVAVVLTFGVSLAFLIINITSNLVSGAAKDVFEYLSVTRHLDDFIKGVIDTSHIIYYITFAFVGLFLAYRSLESMRWKG
jgi:ABC-2 type transport system permease protein